MGFAAVVAGELARVCRRVKATLGQSLNAVGLMVEAIGTRVHRTRLSEQVRVMHQMRWVGQMGN